MRMMLKVNMATEAANELARQGKLGSTIQSILADLKPEAAYFTDDDGERTQFAPHRAPWLSLSENRNGKPTLTNRRSVRQTGTSCIFAGA